MSSYKTLLEPSQQPPLRTDTDNDFGNDYDASSMLGRATIRPGVTMSSMILWAMGGCGLLSVIAILVFGISLGGVPMFAWSSVTTTTPFGTAEYAFGLRAYQSCPSGEPCFVMNWSDADDGLIGFVDNCNTSGQAATGLLIFSIILLLIILVLNGVLVVRREQSLGDDLNYVKFMIPLMALVVIFTIAANANWRTNCHNKIGSFYSSLEVDYDLRLSRAAGLAIFGMLCTLVALPVIVYLYFRISRELEENKY